MRRWKKLLATYGTQIFITIFRTSAIFSHSEPYESIPRPSILLREDSLLILFSHRGQVMQIAFLQTKQ
jgi:hypothetical protein